MRHSHLFVFLASMLLPFFGLGEEKRPNVLVIMIDDQGYYDLGCYGATEVRTPRIDQLAEGGIRFTDYYAAAPICSPSRAGLLTGAYPRRIGMEAWVQRADSKRGIHPDEITLGELFAEEDYFTAAIGKWHMGGAEPFRPRGQGFQHYFGLLHNLDPIEMINFEDKEGPHIWRNGEKVMARPDPAILTEIYTDETIEVIKNSVDKDKPFFIYLAHTMLHVPLGVSEPFRGSSEWGEYGDAIQELDHHVGRLMDTLEEQGVAENTVVLYLSDNGRGPGRNKTQPLQGRKLTTWEAGIRVPGIMWGPGVGVSEGRVSRSVVSALDWYPTLASLGGVRIDEEHPVIDGRDLSRYVKGEVTSVVPLAEAGSLNAGLHERRRWEPTLEWEREFTREEYTEAFFQHGSQGALAAVRWQQWKLVLNPSLTLYDLENDPGEQKPVRGGKERRKLRGMAVLFMEEMSRDARPAGEWTGPADN